MGQQQLLLLVIGLIVAAIAVLAGIEAVQQGQRSAAADRLVDRILSVASHAVAWKTRSDPFAGGDASYERLGEDGMNRLALDARTTAGIVRITAASESKLEITGVSMRYPEIGVITLIEDYSIVSTEIRHDGTITLEE